MNQTTNEDVTVAESVHTLLRPAPQLRPLEGVATADTFATRRVETTRGRPVAIGKALSFASPGTPNRTRARLVSITGQPLRRSEVAGGFVLVWETGADPDTEALLNDAIDLEEALLDELRLDWDADTVGYNFDWTVPGEFFPRPGVRYDVTFGLELLDYEGVFDFGIRVQTHAREYTPPI